jgi:hypothetical protein
LPGHYLERGIGNSQLQFSDILISFDSTPLRDGRPWDAACLLPRSGAFVTTCGTPVVCSY